MMTGPEPRRVAIAPGLRATVERRCGAACESCGFAWPWSLDLFRVREDGPNNAANLIALCPRCSGDRLDPSTPLVARRGLRERMRSANNMRAAVQPLTPARRRALIASRGGWLGGRGEPGGPGALGGRHKVSLRRGGPAG